MSKNLTRCSLSIALLLVFLDGSIAVAQASSPRQSANQLKCTPIGRVLNNSDRDLKAGSLICPGDRLQPKSGRTVEVLCYFNQQILQLKGGNATNQPNGCLPRATRFKPCTPENRSACPKFKGPGEGNNNPAIISPYSSALLNRRPTISWYAVTHATSYTVQVSGQGVDWQVVVKDRVLTYPKNQSALQFGNAYKITVIANRNDSAVSASTSVVNLVPENNAQKIAARIKQIHNLSLPKDEAAFLDLDAIYMSQNLLSETINTLNGRAKAGSRNPTLYRMLGDRYLEAGLPQEAKREYATAVQLAAAVNNSTELAKARIGLRLANAIASLQPG
ncbi:hypothetical protein IQ272_08170 [Chroococcidiopsidales cyanobacterium LEGE 13417]|nr:hypothetical protein [Chroococcidiopsidales cyanobacterium LEGE 13417]